jgi:hypothetical protein
MFSPGALGCKTGPRRGRRGRTPSAATGALVPFPALAPDGSGGSCVGSPIRASTLRRGGGWRRAYYIAGPGEGVCGDPSNLARAPGRGSGCARPGQRERLEDGAGRELSASTFRSSRACEPLQSRRIRSATGGLASRDARRDAASRRGRADLLPLLLPNCPANRCGEAARRAPPSRHRGSGQGPCLEGARDPSNLARAPRRLWGCARPGHRERPEDGAGHELSAPKILQLASSPPRFNAGGRRVRLAAATLPPRCPLPGDPASCHRSAPRLRTRS